MLTAILSLFALAVLAPWLCRAAGRGRVGRAAGILLALPPLGWALYFAGQLQPVAAGELVRDVHPWVPALGVNLSLRLDGLSLLFALLISGIGALVVLYSAGYFADPDRRGRFLASLYAFMASMLGLVLADNLLALFVFWELTSLTSYLLIGFEHEKEQARRAALQALLVTALGGLALLAGFLLLGRVAGTLEISALLAMGPVITGHAFYPAILLLVALGAFTKSAQFPFHFWLPNAMQAPSPASAYLHSATMVKAGVYLLARLQPALGGTEAWLWLLTGAGALTMLLGSWLAIRQDDLKRLLAFSTVGILGTLVLLLGLGTSTAGKAAMVLILAHALYKGALFLVVGNLAHQAGSRDLDQLAGLGRQLPWTAAAATLAALSMAGAPLFFGFFGKETLIQSALGAPRWTLALTAAVLLASMLNVVAAALVAVRPFFFAGGRASPPAREARPELWLGPLLLATVGLGLGLEASVEGRLLVSPAASVALARMLAVEEEHGGLVLLLKIGALAGGAGLYLAAGRLRRLGRRAAERLEEGPPAIYEASMEALQALARGLSRHLQAVPLTRHLRWVVGSAVLLLGVTLALRGALPTAAGMARPQVQELAIAAVILLATAVAVGAKARLAAVAALGVVGFGIALVFLHYGAPDLAMTLVVVETLTVVLLVLAFHHLPRYHRFSAPQVRRRDQVLAIAAGVLVTTLVLISTRTSVGPGISDYFAQQSVPQGHGRNVVNVILVDFRALDTLGEITVLAIAGLGAYALLKLRPAGEDGP